MGEAKAQQKSKREREHDERLAREQALASTLDASNKGFKMMAKLGYKPGATLGKSTDARTEPIHLSMKEDRGGIGMDSEKKRKMRELIEDGERQEKKTKVDQVDYRERLRQEREEERLSRQAHAAQKVLEGLDTEQEEQLAKSTKSDITPVEKRPLKSINVLWRGLIKERREREANENMKREVQNSLTYSKPDYGESDDEEDDSHPSKKGNMLEFFEQDLEDEDEELAEFNALTPVERLDKVAQDLRSRHLYCFWCKTKYDDADFLGCPGATEEAHEL